MNVYCLQLENVSKSYGATRALADVSATFAGGEVHCVLGENGAGKSTLGKVIGGLVDVDRGRVVLHGRPLDLSNAREARRAGIAVVHQELSLAPDLSVRANLCLGSEKRLFDIIPARAERRRAADVLASLGVQLDAEGRVGDLSPAEQQLLEVGKALMAAPRLIVFDEPTATLGAIEKRKLFDVIRDLREQGVAVILITHHIEDVMEVADRVSVMRNGVLVDSFVLGRLSADDVLERLTGKKRAASVRHAMPATAQPVLEVDGLTDRRGHPVRLEIRAGEIAGLYGVVGCGAERVVRGAAGVTRGTGSLRFQLYGKPYRPGSVARALLVGVAYLPAGRASNGIVASRSISENVTVGRAGRFGRFGLLFTRREQDGVHGMLAAVQARFGTIDDPITSLSGGNQQKVLMARMLIGPRDVLVLEEPTAGVDVDSKEQIHRLIRGAADAGAAVLLLSSDLSESIALCHVVHTMYAGHVVYSHVAPTPGDEARILFDVLGKRLDDDAEATGSSARTAGAAP